MAVIVLLAALSCDREPDPVPGLSGGLKFSVLDDPSTKLAYRGVHTSFENREKVGCVIAAKENDGYVFKSVTVWEYEDGFLILQTEDDENVVRHETEDGYISLKQNFEYAFFFYYPYVEGSEPDKDSWKNYPLSVGTDYRQDGSTSSKARLNASDHLWGTYTDPEASIEQEGFYTVNLTFHKKTTSVEVHHDHDEGYTVDRVWIDAVEDSEGIMTSMNFDLTTGESTPAGDPYNGLIYPGLIQEDDGSLHSDGFRMIFVPQTITSWHLNAQITEDGNTETYTVILEDKLMALEEGKLYIFHIAKAADGSIAITDWESDQSDDLFGEEVAMPTELSMWSGRDSEDPVLIKSGETLNIKGKGFYDSESNPVVSYIEVSGVKVFPDTAERDGYEISDETEGFTTITLTLPEIAKDGEVHLFTASWVNVLAGTISTVKPTVSELNRTSYDMDIYDDQNLPELTLKGTDLDLVSHVVFGGDYLADVLSGGNGEQISVNIPHHSETGSLRLELKNGQIIDSGHTFTIENPSIEVTVTSVSGEFKSGKTITVRGTHLKEIDKITLTGKDGVIIQNFNVSDDGKSLTFIFPADAKDGDMKFYAGNDVLLHEEKYKTAVPKYISFRRDSTDMSIFGSNLDIVQTLDVVYEGQPIIQITKSDADFYIKEQDIIRFDINRNLASGMKQLPSRGEVILMTVHQSSIKVSYRFLPEIYVNKIEGSLLPGAVMKFPGRYLDEITSIRILHGEHEDVMKSVGLAGEGEKTFTYDAESGSISFTFGNECTDFTDGAYFEFFIGDEPIISGLYREQQKNEGEKNE